MSINTQYNLYICDRSYVKLVRIDPIFIQYSLVINDAPQAYFTVQMQNPQLEGIGFDPITNTYTCILERGSTEVFRGEIDKISTPGNNVPIGIDNEEAYGTLDRIQFNATSVVGRLKDMIVTPDSGSTVYKRSFSTGTELGTAFSTLLAEAIARGSSPTSVLTAGTVENPIDSSAVTIKLNSAQALYGASYLDWIKTLAELGNADWLVRNGTVVDFVRSRGTDRSTTVVLRLKKGEAGNDLTGITLSIDRQNMVNRVIVAGSNSGVVTIAAERQDNPSITQHGLRENLYPALFGYNDTADGVDKYAITLLARLKQDIPAESIQIYPTQNSSLFGSFELGDTITLDVNWHWISFRKRVRIVGATISVENTGVERIYYTITEPLS